MSSFWRVFKVTFITLFLLVFNVALIFFNEYSWPVTIAVLAYEALLLIACLHTGEVFRTGLIITTTLLVLLELLIAAHHFLAVPRFEEIVSTGLGGVQMMFNPGDFFVPVALAGVFILGLFIYKWNKVPSSGVFRHRRLLGVALLQLMTLGLYSLVWLHHTKKDLQAQGATIISMWIILIPVVGWIIFIWSFSKGIAKVLHLHISSTFIFLLLIPCVTTLIFQHFMNQAE